MVKLYDVDLAALVYARRKLGLSVAAVARAMHVQNSTVTNWERGKTKFSAAVLARLMSLYSLDPEDVFRVKVIEKGGNVNA